MADLDRPLVIRCARCGKKIKVRPTGRLPVYCTPNCRQMHYAKRARAAKKKLTPVATIDEVQRLSLWEALREFGLVQGEMPPRKPKLDQSS